MSQFIPRRVYLKLVIVNMFITELPNNLKSGMRVTRFHLCHYGTVFKNSSHRTFALGYFRQDIPRHFPPLDISHRIALRTFQKSSWASWGSGRIRLGLVRVCMYASSFNDIMVINRNMVNTKRKDKRWLLNSSTKSMQSLGNKVTIVFLRKANQEGKSGRQIRGQMSGWEEFLNTVP